MTLLLVFFFFSSRRRHTRYIGDWSSDVCSSDLPDYKPTFPIEEVMGHIIMPSADKLWGSVATTVSAKGVEEIVPKTDEDRSEERRVGKECRSKSWRNQRRKSNTGKTY